MRLIDADKMRTELFDAVWMTDNDEHMVEEIVERQPTVDAEPVVRCKECMHYRNGICEQIEYIMDGYYHGTFEEKRPDDFCSYGEKKNRGKVHAAD